MSSDSSAALRTDFNIPGNGSRQRPWPLGSEDRFDGDLAFFLMGSWSYWVKRRIESVSLISATTVRHELSIDFRLRPWFPPPPPRPEPEAFYHLPLTLLSKHPLRNLQAYDEGGRMLPVLTRRKRAAISSAALSAMAKSAVVAHHLARLEDKLPTQIPTSLAHAIRIPQSLEDFFYNVSNASGGNDGTGNVSGPTLVEEFLRGYDPSLVTSMPHTWTWERTLTDDGPLWEAQVDDALWRAFLVKQPEFMGLLDDLARMFPVFVPVSANRDMRRILRLSYEAELLVPQIGLTTRVRERMPDQATRWYAATKDAFEGILPRAGNDWETKAFHAHPIGRYESESLGVFEKIGRALGWTPKSVFLATPSVGQGGSYHFEYQAPQGLQIRQATMTVLPQARAKSAEPIRKTVMGAQTLQRAHLYLGSPPENAAGVVAIHLKVAPTTLIRGAWFATLLSAVLLFVGLVKLDVLVNPELGNLGPSLALFLLLPGLIAGLLTRGEEHPLTTNMLFGLRCLCAFVAMLPTSAAFLILGFRSSDLFTPIWYTLLSANVAVLMALSVTWWLAVRRRPDGSAP